MDLTGIYLGATQAFQIHNMIYCFIGVFIGTLIGVLPGIGPAGAVAIILPITLNMSSVSAIIMLAGIYYGAMYGGSTTSILVNIPGEAASVVTCIDGYQMAKKGRAGPALGISAFGSFIAGTLGILLLSILAPPLANVALSFGPPEFFTVMVLGLTLVIYLGSGSMVKSMMMATFGVILGCIGQDLIFGVPRLTYGVEALWDGVGLIPVIMGLFGISEVIENFAGEKTQEIHRGKIKGLLPNIDDWRKSAKPIARGSLIGFCIGLLPGGGGVIASFVSYAIEKKFSNSPERFGKGAIEGVAAPESANNSAAVATMVPLLTLGVPANPVMAIMLAALMIHGTPPGPLLISQHPDLFWGVIVSMYMGNFLLLLLNLPMIPLWVQILKVPYRLLFPLITIFCIIGAYSANHNVADIVILLVSGWVGYLMRKYGYEAAPLILAFVLTPMMENSFRQSLILSQGSFLIFFKSYISMSLFLVTAVFLILPIFKKRKQLTESS
jgi:putative tricarboxylic transport membrane protein